MNPHSESREDGVEKLMRLIQLAYALVSLGAVLWYLIPEHRKRLLAMKAADQTRRVTATLAFHTGARAISLEAACGVENYHVPYWLSRARDAAGRVYDKLRYTQ